MEKLDREWEVVSTHKSGSEARSQELAKPTWLNEVDEMERLYVLIIVVASLKDCITSREKNRGATEDLELVCPEKK